MYCRHMLLHEVLLDVLLLFTAYGHDVPAVIEQPLVQNQAKLHPGKNTVTYEARMLKSLFLRLL